MSADEDRRFRVWYALADLFLDTETQPETYAWIARELTASGFEKAELRRMFEAEVGPAFLFNLLDIAGEWAGWTEDFVRDRMAEPVPSLRFDQKRFLDKIVDQEWAKLEPLLA